MLSTRLDYLAYDMNTNAPFRAEKQKQKRGTRRKKCTQGAHIQEHAHARIERGAESTPAETRQLTTLYGSHPADGTVSVCACVRRRAVCGSSHGSCGRSATKRTFTFSGCALPEHVETFCRGAIKLFNRLFRDRARRPRLNQSETRVSTEPILLHRQIPLNTLRRFFSSYRHCLLTYSVDGGIVSYMCTRARLYSYYRAACRASRARLPCVMQQISREANKTHHFILFAHTYVTSFSFWYCAMPLLIVRGKP